MDPSGSPTRLLATALEHFQSGRNQEAAELCRGVLEADSNNAGAIHLWGALEARAGRVDAAIAYMEKAIQIHPASPKFHNSLGAAYAQKRQFPQAIHHFWQALAQEPYYLTAMRNLAQALRELGYTAESNRMIERAAALAPETVGNPNMLYRLGRRFHDNGEFRDAIEWFRRLVTLKPDFVDGYKLLADALIQEGRIEDAISANEELLSVDPDEWESLKNLGLLLQRKGQTEEATRSMQRAIECRPDYAEAYLSITECKQFAAGDPEIERMQSLCDEESLPPNDRAILYFALGKVHMDLQDYKQAFECFRQGNVLKRQLVDYDPDETTARIDGLIEFFDKTRFEEIGDSFAAPSRLPLFIVGMPRSGTTLVEQIVASHPLVHGAGELNDLRRVSERLSALVQPNTPFPGCLAKLPPAMARKLAAGYVERLSGFSATAVRVTDKMPWNFHALGLIALFWPRATIIHCVRDPVDTCVSCYTRYFNTGQPYSWDLVELGHYYREYQRLAKHWRAVLPVPMLEVKYERLVASQEKITRGIVDFCGLPWDDRCLAFHETERTIKTNPLGARQPIYKSSVGRSKKFKAYLKPLRQALAGKVSPPAK